MSDIYLQITETPTVVTLSAPVVSGALASTVTVANTVTVALDSNSLSALENVTVTVGAAVSISNFPSTQTIAGAVTAGGLWFDGATNIPTPFKVAEEGELYTFSYLQSGTNRIGVVTIGAGTVTIGAGTAQIGSVTASISGTVPISISSVTIGNSVTASLANNLTIDTQGQTSSIYGVRALVVAAGNDSDIATPFKVDNSRNLKVVVNAGSVTIGSALPAGTNRIGVVTIDGGTVTLGAGTAQIGSVTASISGTVPVSGTFWQATQPVSLASTAVTISANPAGPLTTRFGSVTTANTSQLTAAVTNTAREYLLIQNISTGSVTVGVGFSPTTTQGIQLSPGSGITFDSFCPTGAVWWLGATTGAAWTILEG